MSDLIVDQIAFDIMKEIFAKCGSAGQVEKVLEKIAKPVKIFYDDYPNVKTTGKVPEPYCNLPGIKATFDETAKYQAERNVQSIKLRRKQIELEKELEAFKNEGKK